MTLQIKPEFEKFINEQVRAGRYSSPEQVIEAGLASLEQQERLREFAPGELDALLAEGEADIAAGRVYDGERVFEEIAQMSKARRSPSK